MIRQCGTVEIKSASEIALMRQAGLLLHSVMAEVREKVRPGATTYELDQLAQRLIEKAKARPAFLGYRGFPATLCTSIDDEVVHGIPSKKRRLEEGNIVSIDCGLIQHGFYADMARTMPVGEIDPGLAELLTTTESALNRAIDTMREGKRLGDLGRTVENLAADKGYSVVREYTGHGIGRQMHEPPQVPNYFDSAINMRFQAGMVMAIEPMINQGGWRCKVLPDKWTVVTADGSASAHFEDTIAVTDGEPLILTRPEGKLT